MNHSLTTLGDLSDEDNVRQAEHELRRAGTDAALADWARRWGDAAVGRLFKTVEADANTAENKLAEVQVAAEKLIEVLDGMDGNTEQLGLAIAALEAVL